MKKYYYYLVAMMMAVMTFGLTACGDDNDEPDGGDIVGTWFCDTNQKIIDAMDEIYSGGESICQFKADGTYVAVDVSYYTEEWAQYEEENPEIYIERGTYRLSGDRLYMDPYDDNLYKLDYECKIKGNKMTLTLTEGIVISMKFTRVSDSQIEKYL